jgi:hypothetical protein
MYQRFPQTLGIFQILKTSTNISINDNDNDEFSEGVSDEDKLSRRSFTLGEKED